MQRARSVPTWIISKEESTGSTSFSVNSTCVRLNSIVAPSQLSYIIKQLLPEKESGCSDNLRPRWRTYTKSLFYDFKILHLHHTALDAHEMFCYGIYLQSI